MNFKKYHKLHITYSLYRMPAIEALILFLFGIALPTWEVGSDIALAHSFFSKKPCTWEDYVGDHKNDVDGNLISKSRFNFNLSNLSRRL